MLLAAKYSKYLKRKKGSIKIIIGSVPLFLSLQHLNLPVPFLFLFLKKFVPSLSKSIYNKSRTGSKIMSHHFTMLLKTLRRPHIKKFFNIFQDIAKL